jgi:prevent-host-death family protein
MAGHTITISELQSKATQLPEQFSDDPEAITVTRHGKPVMAILPFEDYQQLRKRVDTLIEQLEGMQETLEIMQDEELMAAFREGVEALQRGETIPFLPGIFINY